MKDTYLQIRVSGDQKSRLQRLARSAGQDLSAYVLARSLPSTHLRFVEIIDHLRDADDPRYLLAELSDLLRAIPSDEFAAVTSHVELSAHEDVTANYVAAMVEHAAATRKVAPPSWTRRIQPLESPWFAADLPALRPWLLIASPAAFKKRNIFVDSTIDDRV